MHIFEHLDGLIDYATINQLSLDQMEFKLSPILYREFIKDATKQIKEETSLIFGFSVTHYKNIQITELSDKTGLAVILDYKTPNILSKGPRE